MVYLYYTLEIMCSEHTLVPRNCGQASLTADWRNMQVPRRPGFSGCDLVYFKSPTSYSWLGVSAICVRRVLRGTAPQGLTGMLVPRRVFCIDKYYSKSTSWLASPPKYKNK